ncbi:MAG: beta-N-acetylhexosaminidase [Deltaproteobacteria bacterium]|nr:MAG: beta-N-acetylhexosaminidase [Deltaproteobacteria bacterium]
MATSLLRRTAGQLFMVGLPRPALDRETREFLAERCPGGVILFKRNIRSAEQLRRLVADIHATGAGVPPLVALDHEGGRVDRLPHPPFTHFPPMALVGESGDTRLAEAVGRAMGRELRAVGIDLDFAPVLDVWSNPRNRVIGDRAFGTTPRAVARLALAFARGLARAGVLACGKHFPGHGATVGDSHFVLPRVRRSRRALAATELVPFARAAAADIPALMTAHVVVPALDARRPATVSPKICRDLLRRRLRFRGVLFSDDLEMQAMAGRRRVGRAAVEALRAGCDMLLVCQSLAAAREAMAAVEDALGRGRLEAGAIATSLMRIQGLRRRLTAPPARASLAWPAHRQLARRVAAIAPQASARAAG